MDNPFLQLEHLHNLQIAVLRFEGMRDMLVWAKRLDMDTKNRIALAEKLLEITQLLAKAQTKFLDARKERADADAAGRTA